jgi:hypothetical protein
MVAILKTMPRSGSTRSPTRTWVLALVTLGGYAVWHHHELNRELRDFGVDVRPVLSTIALFPGIVVIAPALVTLWRTSNRLRVAQETVGLVPTSDPRSSVVSLLLALFVPYHQREANRVWRAER